MPSIGLIPYEFYIERRGRPESYVNLSSFGDGRYTGKTILLSFLEHLKNQPHEVEEDAKRTFKLDDYTQDNDSVYGTILMGFYGESSSFLDTDTGDTVYVRNPNDAEVRSYFFYIDLSDENPGEHLVVFQAYDYKGIKTEFLNRLSEFLRHYEGGDFNRRYTFTLKNIVPGSYINRVAANIKIEKIRFIQSIARMRVEQNPVPVKVDVQVTPPKHVANTLAQRIVQYVNGAIPNFKGVFTVPDEVGAFDFSDVKVQGEINGRHTTLSIREFTLPHYQYTVDSDTLRANSDGYFMPEAFLGDAHDLVHELREEMAAKQPTSDDE